MKSATRTTRTISSAIAVLMVLALGTACSDSGDESAQNDVIPANGDGDGGNPAPAGDGATQDDPSAGGPTIIANVDPVDAGIGEVQLGGTTYHFEDLGDPGYRSSCGPNINEPGILKVKLPVVPDPDAGGSDNWGYVTATLVHEELVFTDDLEISVDGNYWSLEGDRLSEWSVSEDRLHATGSATVTSREDGGTDEITFSFTCPSS